MKKIIHIDMDCFYAAIEERDRPELRGKPIAVGGSREQRGVLCTANYEARKYGLRSAMAAATARRLCPQANFLPVDMKKYKAVSKQLHEIFHQFTDVIEPLSLDEAYLDVTECQQFKGSATLIAKEIKRLVSDNLQLTASAGVAPNKFLAKIASDWDKPDGLFVITPEMVDDFVLQLPIEELFGVGKKTAEKMHKLGFKTCGDLQQAEPAYLVAKFGKFGERLFELSRGIDDRKVNPNRIRKSLSVEHTYSTDLPSIVQAGQQILQLFTELNQRLEKHDDKVIKQLFVKIKFYDFQQTTMETIASQPNLDIYHNLLEEAFARQAKPIRLLGLGVRFAEVHEDEKQLDFFPQIESNE